MISKTEWRNLINARTIRDQRRNEIVFLEAEREEPGGSVQERLLAGAPIDGGRLG